MLAVGAITDIASAILIDPSITAKIVVVWLGGNGYQWPDPMEFNYRQDLHASRIVFDSGVPFVQIPCTPVTTHLSTTKAEMEFYLKGKGRIAEYLLKIFKQFRHGSDVGYSKVIWDMTTVAWVVNQNWIPTQIIHSPVITEDYTYSINPNRHLMRVAYFVKRNPVFNDFFNKLTSNQ